MWVLCFAHIPLVVNRTFNETPTERLQQLYFSDMIAKFQHSVTLASYNEFLITKTKQHFKKENIPFKIEIYLGRGVTRTGLEQVFQPCLCDTSYG